MTLTDPRDLPSLEVIFGSNSLVRHSLHRANISTAAPVMLLPPEELVSQLRGIGKTGAAYITGALNHVGLPHHKFQDRLVDFIDQAFGGIGKAPIGILHVTSIVSENCTRSLYAPLKLVRALEDVIDPHMSIEDLPKVTSEQFEEAISGQTPFGPVSKAMSRDIKEINQRLRHLDWDQLICMDAPAAHSTGLRVVR